MTTNRSHRQDYRQPCRSSPTSACKRWPKSCKTWPVTRGGQAEDDATRAAIANGIAQGHRGEFATDAEVAEAYARFRTMKVRYTRQAILDLLTIADYIR